jgi:membrane protein
MARLPHLHRRGWRLHDVAKLAAHVLRAFVRNGAIDLAGAVAYNSLLSIIPLFLVVTAIFGRFVEREGFIDVVLREIAQVAPADLSAPLTDALRSLLEVPYTGGIVGAITLLFFSTLAFRTLHHALDVIFSHRREGADPRSLLASMLISVAYVFAIGMLSLLHAIVVVRLDGIFSLGERIPRWAALFGTCGMALVLASIYLVMPSRKGNVRAALIGGAFAAVLWEGVQWGLVWYFENVSGVNRIYGSMAAVIVILFSFELAAGIVLLGAQLTAEIEKRWKASLRWYEAPTWGWELSTSLRVLKDGARNPPAAGDRGSVTKPPTHDV